MIDPDTVYQGDVSSSNNTLAFEYGLAAIHEMYPFVVQTFNFGFQFFVKRE